MSTHRAQPARSRPRFPEGYGVPDGDEGLLEWASIEARLIASENYWLSSVRPDGRPHTIPRWGVWVGGRFYYDGAPTTRHARNLDANPACTLNLEDGKEAVIAEGTSVPTRADAEGLGAQIAAAFSKYHAQGYEPGPDSWAGDDGAGLRVFTPQVVLAWFAFPTDATRFTFE